MAFLTHPEAYLFAIAFFISSVIAFIATAGLWRHHKLGWYSGVVLVLVHIITITGFLKEERVRHLLLAEALKEGLTSPDLDAVVELITFVFTGRFSSSCCEFAPRYSIDIARNTELPANACRHLFIKNKEGALDCRRIVSKSAL